MVRRKTHRSARKPKRKVCKIHNVTVRTGSGKKIQARISCRGKITMTRAGRKTFKALKCKCRRKTAAMRARAAHRRSPPVYGGLMRY